MSLNLKTAHAVDKFFFTNTPSAPSRNTDAVKTPIRSSHFKCDLEKINKNHWTRLFQFELTATSKA